MEGVGKSGSNISTKYKKYMVIFELCEIKVIILYIYVQLEFKLWGEMHIKNNPHQECIQCIK